MKNLLFEVILLHSTLMIEISLLNLNLFSSSISGRSTTIVALFDRSVSVATTFSPKFNFSKYFVIKQRVRTNSFFFSNFLNNISVLWFFCSVFIIKFTKNARIFKTELWRRFCQHWMLLQIDLWAKDAIWKKSCERYLLRKRGTKGYGISNDLIFH